MRVIDSILAYTLTVVGILVSAYIPMLKTTGSIDISLNWWRVALAAIVAIIVVAAQEVGGDEDGKKRNFWKRMSNALAHGIAWAQIVSIAS